MDMPGDRLVVITGGPGSGKTTLIEALERRGWARSAEAGRAIIRHQMAIGGDALPWADRALYAELMLSWELRSYDDALARGTPVIMDRGVPDVIGYLRLCGLPVPEHVLQAVRRCRYHRRVFIAPPWPEIFEQDSERRQRLDDATRTFEMMREVYDSLGHDLVELPRTSVEERVGFVQARWPA